jgi:hypothetical protein
MTVKVNIPVSYIVHGYLPNRRQPRSYLYAEIMPYEIREVTAANAPIAVEWYDPRINGSSMHLITYEPDAIEVFDPEGRQHTRFHDGKHWLRVLAGNTSHGVRDRSAAVTTADAIRHIENGDFAKLFGFAGKTQSQKTLNIVTGDPSDRFDIVKNNTRERSLSAFDGMDLLSVDGNLYIACGQPCYMMVPGYPLANQHRIVNVPYVDVWAHRSPRDMTYSRFKYIPLSAADLVTMDTNELTNDIIERMRVPAVLLPESMSEEIDMGVLADHYVHDFMAKAYAKLRAPFAYTEHYFEQRTMEEKAAYLAMHEQDWMRNGEAFMLPVELLQKAMDVLDGRDIGFVPEKVGLPAPR